MSEEQKEPGFFSQIKNQLITTIGLIVTAGGGLVVSNMDAIFAPPAPIEEIVIQDTIKSKPQEIIINIPEQKQPVKETIIIKEVPAKKEKKVTHDSW